MLNPRKILRLLLAAVAAGSVTTLAAADAAYREVAESRAAKIVAGLDRAAEQGRAAIVTAVIADQYCDLHDLHEARDAALRELEKVPETQQAYVEAAREALQRETEHAVLLLHTAYLARLAAHLEADEIEQVKDGMTYGRMPRDYHIYLEMLPDLSAEQKAQIYAWMWEARERAMDGGSSEEKHWWFGKYKGRINNYLAADGYDLKEAERLMMERRQQSTGTP